MNRLEAKFSALRRQGRKAFIPYIMAGDPSVEETKETVLLLDRCGADIVELGVPFTDPLADGPIIQRAAERALSAGVTLRRVLDFVTEARRDTAVPLVLMTYYNPVFRYGEERFVKDAVEAGVDGVIIPDLPPDEAGDLIKTSKKSGLATIFLVAPTSTEDRIRKIARVSTGFIYYVSMTGITGARLSAGSSIEESVGNIRRVSRKPIAVGFGVSTPDEAGDIAAFADGVIVGSAIVRRLQESRESLGEFVQGLRKAIK